MSLLLKIAARQLPNGKELPLPRYHNVHDAAFDLYAAGQHILVDGERPLPIPTGLALAIPPGYFGAIRSRSGLALKGVAAFHGTIDAGYRGEIKVLMSYRSTDEEREHLRKFNVRPPFTIDSGTRIAQMVIMRCVQAQLVEVDSLGESDRGAGGFGSTGTHG